MTRQVVTKICGITRAQDAELAVELGADAIGFIFWPQSPRVVGIRTAQRIASALPDSVARVGVFVNASPDEVLRFVETVGLHIVQLHGDEDVREYVTLRGNGGTPLSTTASDNVTLWKGIALTDDAAAARAARLESAITPLVDASDPERRGGTGRVADWTRAHDLAATRPIVLAGGLSAANIARAIAAVRPWAVDVSSGVEELPGIKSPARLREFFAALASASSEVV